MRSRRARFLGELPLVLAAGVAASVAPSTARGDTIVQTTNLSMALRTSKWMVVAEVVEARKTSEHLFEYHFDVRELLRGEPESTTIRVCSVYSIAPGDVALVAWRGPGMGGGACPDGYYDSPESGPTILLPMVGRSILEAEHLVLLTEPQANFFGCRADAVRIDTVADVPINWPPTHYTLRRFAMEWSEFERCVMEPRPE